MKGRSWLGAALLGLAMAPAAGAPVPAAGDEAAAAALMSAVAANRPMLRVFLQRMPKGGDLHNHLGGAIYAEDLLRWAAAAGLCVTTDRPRIVSAPCDRPNTVPAATLGADAALYSRTIDALSTRGFENGTGDPHVSGADRFFATFDDFIPAYIGNAGKALAIAREQAAGDNLQYLELQVGAGPLGTVLSKDWAEGLADDDFAGMLARLTPLMPKALAAARLELDGIEREAGQRQGCGTRQAAPGCAVAARYLMAAMRTYAPASVFAEIAYGFAVVRADPRYVGVDIVAPEHEPVAIRDYALHMRMFAFLKQRFPEVPLSLHAGEITLGMVPPRDLKSHIHDAVTVAGAKRIGHGVDIAYEEDSLALLQRMAREKIAVEINLTSNAVILGVQGANHPLALYRAAGVPIALATDDEGVSRTDMTNEYMRAATEQRLDYRELKAIARDSLEYAFLPGASLWRGTVGGAIAAPCAAATDGAACRRFADGSAKASTQLALEDAFRTFEHDVVPAMRTTLGMAASP